MDVTLTIPLDIEARVIAAVSAQYGPIPLAQVLQQFVVSIVSSHEVGASTDLARTAAADRVRDEIIIPVRSAGVATPISDDGGNK